MHLRVWAAAAALACMTQAYHAQGKTAAPLRTVENGVLISSANPALRFVPSEGFVYAGDFAITLKGTALAERHHWVVADSDHVKKLLILQFEGFVDGVDGRYTFALPKENLTGSNYKFSPLLVDLDGVGFLHNTWALDYAANSLENPGMEGEATLTLLKEKGYAIDNDVIMSRFVQAFGDDGRHELIIFYLEPLSESGKTLAEFPDGELATEDFEIYSDAVTARSIESFHIDFGAK